MNTLEELAQIARTRPEQLKEQKKKCTKLIGYIGRGRTKKDLTPLTYEDPYMATAESWLRMGGSGNPGYEAEQLCENLETYRPDGMLFGFSDFDRWLGSSHRLLARIIEEKTGTPTFYIEGDLWEDRDYSPEALRTKIESICEIVKMKKS